MAACPYCAATLAKVPQRKTKCPACGQFMYFKSTPDNREKRIMTQAQADAAEAAWSKYHETNATNNMAVGLGVVMQAGESRSQYLERVARTAPDGHTRAMAAQMKSQMSIERGTVTEEDFRWAQVASAERLAELLSKRKTQPGMKVEIMGGTLCKTDEPCRSMDGQVFDMDEAMAKLPIPNRQCPLMERGTVCNCSWTAWMPDWPPRRKQV